MISSVKHYCNHLLHSSILSLTYSSGNLNLWTLLSPHSTEIVLVRTTNGQIPQSRHLLVLKDSLKLSYPLFSERVHHSNLTSTFWTFLVHVFSNTLPLPNWCFPGFYHQPSFLPSVFSSLCYTNA
jgi:hypothetical protein